MGQTDSRNRRRFVCFMGMILAFGTLVAQSAEKPAAIVEGYPAFDAPIVRMAIRPQRVPVVDYTRQWLDTAEYGNYSLVVIVGNLARAGIEHNTYTPDDLKNLEAFLEQGGRLLLMRRNTGVFATAEGRKYMQRRFGLYSAKAVAGEMRILEPAHPWVSHLDPGEGHPWIRLQGASPLRVRKGERIIGNRLGHTLLYRRRIGKGQIVYVGWELANYKPHGRKPSTVEQERIFHEQVRVLQNMMSDLYPGRDATNRAPPLSRPPYRLQADYRQKEAGNGDGYVSHPPMRPLPVPSTRPPAKGPARFVDAKRGSDAGDGSQNSPWKTLGHALTQLLAGDTLYLRRGVYFERVRVTQSGEPEKPITIRSYPGEMAILDGGFREFQELPAIAWRPCEDGAPGEYESVKTYPDIQARKGSTNLMGNFEDSMIPLHGYRYREDLQHTSSYWKVDRKMDVGPGNVVYCGPGVWYNKETQRVHCRLAHTDIRALGKDNYRGETDPRKLGLVIAARSAGSPLVVEGVKHLRLQDLVVRGSCASTLNISKSEDVELDGLTVYGGSSAATVHYTRNLRVYNSAFRGAAAPWTFRGSLKYRAIETRVFSASGWYPTENEDFELAYSEFTDSVDGVFVGNVNGLRFHHNLLENFSDDGLFVTATATYDGRTPGGNLRIYQNILSRCLTTFAYGVGHGRQVAVPEGRQTGKGVWVYRNIFDFRKWVGYHVPSRPEDEFSSYGRSCGDHGGPVWEPMFIYHNTIISRSSSFRNYYLNGWAGHMHGGTKRRLLNNIYVQIDGLPGTVFPQTTKVDLEADGNLHWSISDGPEAKGGFPNRLHASVRKIAEGERRKLEQERLKKVRERNLNREDDLLVEEKPVPPVRKIETPDWTKHDRFADPEFVSFHAEPGKPLNCRIREASPTVDAGVPVPSEWPDPPRAADLGPPDIGAIPLGHQGWRVGIYGRIRVGGD